MDLVSSNYRRRVAYLAGAIGSRDDLGRGWREQAAGALESYDIMCFSPANPYLGLSYIRDHCQYIMEVNRCAIMNAGVVLVNLWDAGVGTAREIEIASMLNIPVVAFGAKRISVAMSDVVLCNDLHEAIRNVLRLFGVYSV